MTRTRLDSLPHVTVRGTARPPRAMILCAGLGTRLGALSDQRPKPMLPVCDRPILEYGIANLVAHGITELVINLHHRGDVIRDELGDGRRLGARIQYVEEAAILGTGGGLKHALPLLDPDGDDAPFVSCNGKLIFDADLTGAVAAYHAAHAADPGLLAVMIVRRVDDARAWGAVRVEHDDDGPRITDIRGDGDHMFLGVHVTRPSVIARLPDGEADVIGDGYLPWLRAGARLAGFEQSRGYFAEHSTPARYLASNLALAAATEPLRHPPGKLGGVDPTARIHPDAVIRGAVRIGAWATIGAGATVEDAVIGERATVAPGVAVTRAVVWARTAVAAPARDAIVTPAAVVDARA
jgi:NDP-sugar pyrophosphorylase family protein